MGRQQHALIREVDRHADQAGIVALDTSFMSERVYAVRSTEDGLQLGLALVSPPQQKRFAIDLAQPAWSWGYAAVDESAIRGFIAASYERWNRRLAIWHFYVDRDSRRQGIGRRLMEQAIDYDRRAGAMTAWVETSNLNYPAIEAYRRLGFSICGFDLTLYQGTPAAGEFAIFLARRINCAASDLNSI